MVKLFFSNQKKFFKNKNLISYPARGQFKKKRYRNRFNKSSLEIVALIDMRISLRGF